MRAHLCKSRQSNVCISAVHVCVYVQAHSQLPVFSGKPEGPFCLSCNFILRNERNRRMKKSVRFSEKLVSPGLPGLQVATRLRPVVQSPISTNPGLTLNKTNGVNPGLALIWLRTTGP